MAKERILVVDDEYLIRWSLQQDLSKEGYEVMVAESGEEAMRLVRESPPDLVLQDIQLPGMDGIETREKIKEVDPEIVVHDHRLRDGGHGRRRHEAGRPRLHQ